MVLEYIDQIFFFIVMKIKYLYFLLCCVFHKGLAQYTDVINSNRPGESMGAYSIGKSLFQLETGTYIVHENHRLFDILTDGYGFNANFRWGLFKEKLEFNLDLQYQKDEYITPELYQKRSALRKTIVGAKYLLYDPYKNYEEELNIRSWKQNKQFKWHQLIPAISIYAGANLNFENPFTFKKDPIVSPKIVLLLQNQLMNGYVVTTNIIADKFTSIYPSYGYIITVSKGLTDKISVFAENQGYKSDFYSDAIARFGGAFLLTNSVQLDAAFTFNAKSTPLVLYGSAGISWRFDENYKAVMIKVESKESKKQKEREKILNDLEKKSDKKKKKQKKLESETTSKQE